MNSPEQLGQVKLRQAMRRSQPHAAAGLARMLLQLQPRELEHLHHRGAARQQQAAGIRQAHGACRAVEQAHAQARFQLGHVFADVGLGHIERARRHGKTAAVGDFAKGPYEFEGVHCFRLRNALVRF
jgi:hypothetical protein